MNKVYVLTEINYGDFCLDCDTLQQLKIFSKEEDLINYCKQQINNNLQDFHLDNNCNIDDIKVGDVIRFFWNYQDNWQSYFELILSEEEIL